MKIKNKQSGEIFNSEKCSEEMLIGYFFVSPLLFKKELIVNSFFVSEKEFNKNYEVINDTN